MDLIDLAYDVAMNGEEIYDAYDDLNHPAELSPPPALELGAEITVANEIDDGPPPALSPSAVGVTHPAASNVENIPPVPGQVITLTGENLQPGTSTLLSEFTLNEEDLGVSCAPVRVLTCNVTGERSFRSTRQQKEPKNKKRDDDKLTEADIKKRERVRQAVAKSRAERNAQKKEDDRKTHNKQEEGRRLRRREENIAKGKVANWA